MRLVAPNDRRSTGPVWNGQYSTYDLVLLAIPLAFLLGTLGPVLAGSPLGLGVRVGGVSAAVVTGYALFGAAPRARTGTRNVR